ncbi:hypothetical protein ACFWNK_15120 [Streptomyces sp. NPDC058417]|uniref:hypothetical protein n=1 Tax=unclassified Streptomyces TaxID=2593676 RepID=UPI0036519FE5
MTGTTPRAAGTGGPITGQPSPAQPWRPVRHRGRHRKPRSPRGALFAAGGLALTAGALSLVRLAPDPRPGAGAPEAAPRLALEPTAHDTPRATPAGATAPAPSARRSGPPTGAAGGSPTAAVRTPSGPYDPTAAQPDGNRRTGAAGKDGSDGNNGRTEPGAAAAPNAPTAAPTGAATPAPPPRPTRSTPPPAPTVTGVPPTPRPPADRPGVCVPVIGLCVDVLSGPAD